MHPAICCHTSTEPYCSGQCLTHQTVDPSEKVPLKDENAPVVDVQLLKVPLDSVQVHSLSVVPIPESDMNAVAPASRQKHNMQTADTGLGSIECICSCKMCSTINSQALHNAVTSEQSEGKHTDPDTMPLRCHQRRHSAVEPPPPADPLTCAGAACSLPSAVCLAQRRDRASVSAGSLAAAAHKCLITAGWPCAVVRLDRWST